MTGQIIDAHSHILPGMDDGSDNARTTEKICFELKQQGVTTVCATPHFYRWEERSEDFLNRRRAALEAAQQALAGLDVRCGAEVAFFRGIAQSSSLDSLCLEGTRVLLLEMPFALWTVQDTEEVFSLLLDRGFQVVLAHPERFLGFSGNRHHLERLAEAGAYFQINADALLHWQTRHSALELLRITDAPLLGTDAHNLRNRAPRMQSARRVVARKLGQAFLQRLDETAQRLICAEQEVTHGKD